MNARPLPRTAYQLALQQNFFEKFLPDAVHPVKGVPVRLYPYQRTAIEGLFTHQRTLWEWGRQTGKSSDAGVYLAFMSQEVRGDAIVSSFRHERSKEIVKWCRDWCYAHRDKSYADNIEGDAATHLTFKSGFRVIALPRGETSRGYATVIRILDESQLINDSDLSAFLPTGLTTQPRDLFMGTVWGTAGWWWRFVQNAKQYSYALSQITSEEALEPNGPVIKSELDNLKLVLGELAYNQECLLIPIPDVDVFYGSDLVKSCLGERVVLAQLPENALIIIGFDHAVSGGDESIAWVGALVDGVLIEVETIAWLNTLIHEQVNGGSGRPGLKQLYPHAIYWIDGTAEGGKEALGVFQRAGLKTEAVDFSKSKQTLQINLKNLMQIRAVRFADERLRVQLSHYKFAESATKGKYKFGEKGTPDDRVDAFALAAYGASRPVTYLPGSRPVTRVL